MKRGRLVGAILAVIALFGIHTQQVGRASAMDQTQYTPVQQRVLDSMLIDAQRAAKGALSDREKRLLAGAEIIDQALKARYPDADFTLMGMCSVMFDGVTWEMEGQWQDERFMVTAVSEKEDFSDLTVREGLFSLTRRQEMTALLLRWMEDAGAVQPRAYVNITGMYDERCDGAKTLEEMLQGGVRMAVSAQIFISGEQNAHVDAQWLDQTVKCRGVDILANVWVLPEVPEGEPTRDWAREMRTRDDTAHFDLYVDGEPEC